MVGRGMPVGWWIRWEVSREETALSCDWRGAGMTLVRVPRFAALFWDIEALNCPLAIFIRHE